MASIFCACCKKSTPFNAEVRYRSRRRASGYSQLCKLCDKVRLAALRARPVDQIRASRAKWAVAARKQRAALGPRRIKDRQLRALYDITIEQYDSLVARQENACAICRQVDARQALSVDHNHETGFIRGLLCNNCNRAIGLLKDSPDLLGAALEYLTPRLALLVSSGG